MVKEIVNANDGKITTVRSDNDGIRKTRDDIFRNPEGAEPLSLADLDKELADRKPAK
jgi:hypothetical protein